MESELGVHIIAKAPLAGWCKTRLIPELGKTKAAELHEALLKDQIEQLNEADIPFHIWMGFPPDSSQQAFFPKFRNITNVVSVELGELLERSLAYGLNELRWAKSVFVGADAPWSVSLHLKEALRNIKERKVVLGPALDGGVYLIGAPHSWQSPFLNVPWGSRDVFQALCQNAVRESFEPYILPQGRDVDTVEDLRYLQNQPDAAKALPFTFGLFSEGFHYRSGP